MRAGRAVLLACLAALLPSAAPAHAAGPGTVSSGTFGDYSYLVYVPSTYNPATPAPLVVMTHGCQTTAEQQMRANLYNDVAEREGFVVLYPDVNPAEAGQPGPLNQCWQFPLPTDWHRDAGDPAAIAGMTHAVMAKENIDTQRVYMVGMSAGSFMTSIMAAAYPDLFAAVAINAGGAYADGTCLVVPAGLPAATSAQMAFDEMGTRARVVPRLVSGGDMDHGIPPACADKALEQGLRTDNLVLSGTQDGPISLAPASTREVPAETPGGYSTTVSTYLDPGGCEIGERWLIHGMDHFWPGGSTDPELKGFTDPRGPNGAELTWAFLSRYTMSSTANTCTEAPRAPATCTVRIRVPKGVTRVRVNGARRTVRVRHHRVRASAPAGTRVVVRGHTRAGRPFVRHRTVPGCA